MKTHLLEREQLLGGTVEDLFLSRRRRDGGHSGALREHARESAFFSDARNLARITPGWLGFRILRVEPETMGAGTILEYTIRLVGVPVRWRTRITDWEAGRQFTDVQERGPYALWEHTHSFRDIAGGVLMRDRVRYALPLGPLGSIAHVLAVRASLRRIFDYRNDVLAALFPMRDPGAAPSSSPKNPTSPSAPAPPRSTGTTT